MAALDVRLPGVRFLPRPGEPPPALPPLDVAAFIGFAERGPLHRPTVIEDPHGYERIFGGDLPLARTPGGRTEVAYLRPSVASFFANGGRRCFVVRVAGERARAARFRMPGLIGIDADGGRHVAIAAASSEGRWGDRLRLAVRLAATRLPTAQFAMTEPRKLRWRVTPRGDAAPQPGDLLRLSFADAQQAPLLFPVTDQLQPKPGGAAEFDAFMAGDASGAPAGGLPAPIHAIERLTFDLFVREGPTTYPVLRDLGFGAGHPRFWITALAADSASPLAGLPEEEAFKWYLPLSMPSIVSDAQFEDDLLDVTGLDDLDTFSSALFLDPYLVPAAEVQPHGGETLLTEAFSRAYEQHKPLLGVHGVTFIDEVAVVAVPDAVHPEWHRPDAEPPIQPAVVRPAEPPDWSRFRNCVQAQRSEPSAPNASPAAVVDLPISVDDAHFSVEPLLDVQQSVAALCQARHDLVGLLSLPVHYQRRECLDWIDRFRTRLGLPAARAQDDDLALLADLSYVAVYHPWILVPDAGSDDGVRPIPADGAVCGALARRERERQVWISPANQPLIDVLGVTPSLNADLLVDLFARQFNIIMREPTDVRAVSAHTLSDRRTLLQLSVRRLLILLRKLAVQRGMEYVFQPNDERLRFGVRSALEDVLRGMFELGAFSGGTAEESYRVDTGPGLNTRVSIDSGELIAEVQVAPSEPLEFIVVLLKRVGDGVLQAAEG